MYRSVQLSVHEFSEWARKDLAEEQNEEDGDEEDGDDGGPHHEPDAHRAVVLGTERLREVGVECLRTFQIPGFGFRVSGSGLRG